MTESLTPQAQGLLILVIAPNLEELLIDLLLENPAVEGFTSSHVSGHGATTTKLSITEQVTGRQQRVQLMVYGVLNDLQQLINTIKTTFEHAEIRCILVPVVASQMS